MLKWWQDKIAFLWRHSFFRLVIWRFVKALNQQVIIHSLWLTLTVRERLSKIINFVPAVLRWYKPALLPGEESKMRFPKLISVVKQRSCADVIWGVMNIKRLERPVLNVNRMPVELVLKSLLLLHLSHLLAGVKLLFHSVYFWWHHL